MINVLQLTQWILTNRRGNAFKGYDTRKILEELCKCTDEESILCVTQGQEIVGIVCAKRDDIKRTLYVWDILTKGRGVIKQMVKYFMEKFPGYTLQGKAHGRARQFTDIEKLFRRIQ